MFHWYGLIVGVAGVAGWSVAERIEPKVNKVLPSVLLFGIVGARAYHVIDLWEHYSQNLGQILAIWRGGLGILGGLVGGAVGFWIAMQKRTNAKMNRWRVLASVVTGLPLAQAIGRWGNLVNNELWGEGGKPLFLYESLLSLVLFGLILSVRGQAAKTRVGIYLVGYGLIRLALEGLRVEAWVMDYYFAGLMVVSGVLLWVGTKRRDK